MFGDADSADSLQKEVDELKKKLKEESERKNELAMTLCGLRNQHMESDEGKELGRNFKPRSSDIFIVTYPKCGTTWMTQVRPSRWS